MKITKIQNDLLIRVVSERTNKLNDDFRNLKSIMEEGRDISIEEMDEYLTKTVELRELHLIMLKLAKVQKNPKVANGIKEISQGQLEWIERLLDENGVCGVKSGFLAYEQ